MSDHEYAMMRDIIARQGARIALLEAKLRAAEKMFATLEAATIKDLQQRETSPHIVRDEVEKDTH